MRDGRETDRQASDLEKLKKVFRFSPLSLIRGWCRPVRGTVRLMILFNILFVLTALGIPLITRELVDSAAAGAREPMIRFGCLLAAAIVLERVFSFLSGHLQNRASADLQKEIQRNAVQGLLTRDWAALQGYHSGELVNRIFSDATEVRDGVTEVLPSLVRTGVSFIGAAAILITMDWRFVPALLLGSAAWTAFTRMFRGPVRARHRRMQRAEDAMHAAAQETVGNIRVLKAGAAEARAMERVGKRAEELAEARKRNGMLAVFMRSGVGSVLDFSWLFCYLWGCVKIFRGEFSYGSLAALIPLVSRLQNPVAGAADLMARVYAATSSAERLQEFLSLPEDEDLGSLTDFDRIRLDHVSFRYGDGTEDVLRDACGEIRKGDSISLRGASGEGKTSLFQLLLGIWKPTSGRIVFEGGGREVPASRGIRRLFAYVPQGNTLFSGTLRENLLLFAGDAPPEAVRAALRAACIEELADEIGLDAVLGEHGIGLSEGQAQRVAAARAILSGAPILLLDEATSALDEATEAAMLRNIAGLRDRTVILVSHRPAADGICEKHWTLRQGRLLTEAEENTPG